MNFKTVNQPQIGFQDFPLICRICLCYENLNNFEDRNSLIALFTKITDIQIDPNDIFPKNICLQCLNKLEDILQFLDLAKDSDLTLRQATIKCEIKEESLDNREMYDASQNYGMCSQVNNPSSDGDKRNLKHIEDENYLNEEPSSSSEEDYVPTPPPKKTYSCNICFKIFSNKPNMYKHKKLHTGIKPFECAICKKTFAKKDNLSIHIKVHTGAKPFQCTICQKSFTQSGNLNVHLKSHLNIKPFSCTICLKAFTQKWILTDHLRRHSGERPFKCEVCLKDFAMKQSYRNHMRSHKQEDNNCSDPIKIHENVTHKPLTVDILEIKTEN